MLPYITLLSWYTLTSVNITLHNVPPSLMSPNLGNGCAQFKYPSLLSHATPIYHGFWHYSNPPKNSNHTLIHVMLSSIVIIAMLTLCYFHNVTCYTSFLLSCIHVTSTHLLNITCTLISTSMTLGRLKCIASYVGPRMIQHSCLNSSYDMSSAGY